MKIIKRIGEIITLSGMGLGLYGAMTTTGWIQLDGIALILSGGFLLLWFKDQGGIMFLFLMLMIFIIYCGETNSEKYLDDNYFPPDN